MTIDLSIGGFRIRLREDAGRPLFFWPAQAFEKFEARAPAEPDLEFAVEVADALPDVPAGRLLFDSASGLWTLREAPEGLRIDCLDPKTRRPLNRALVSSDFSRGRIVTAQGPAWSPSRVLNPIVEICLLTLLSRAGGLMLHAAGVAFEGRGVVFTGPSGAGKSTLSGLFVARGATILNDERVIVRDAAGAPTLHGTPWCGSNPEVNNADAPLRGLYFIRHGAGAHRLRELSCPQAAALCLKQAFLPYWDAEGLARALDAADALFGSIPRLEYSFLNDPSAVDGILDAEALVQEVP